LLSQQQWVDTIKQLQNNEIRDWVINHLDSDVMWTIAGSDEALSSAQAVM